jgi:hypothetical protein
MQMVLAMAEGAASNYTNINNYYIIIIVIIIIIIYNNNNYNINNKYNLTINVRLFTLQEPGHAHGVSNGR